MGRDCFARRFLGRCLAVGFKGFEKFSEKVSEKGS